MEDNDTLGNILKNPSSFATIKRMVNNKNKITTLLNDSQFGQKNIQEIFSRSNSSWSGWLGFSTDHSPEYQDVCIHLIDENLVDSYLDLPIVKNFALSHVEKLSNPLEILSKIAKNNEDGKLDQGDITELYKPNQKNLLLLDCHTLGILNNDDTVGTTGVFGGEGPYIEREIESLKDWVEKTKKAKELTFDIQDKENVFQAQQSAIKFIRALGIGGSAFYLGSSFIGATRATGSAVTAFYASTHFDTPIFNWLTGNSKEPLLSNIGVELARFGQIARFIDSEVKKNITKEELFDQVLKTTTLMAITSSACTPFLVKARITSYIINDGINVSMEASAEVSKIYNQIAPQINELLNETSHHEMGKKISDLEKKTKDNLKQAWKNLQKIYDKSTKLVIAAIVGASCFLAISALSIATGGIAPSVAIAVSLIVAASAYLGYEPAQKALSSFTDFCSSSYKKLESFLSKTFGKSKPTQNIQSEINELVADNSTEDQRYLTDYTKQFEETLTSHGVDQEYAKIIIKEELTYDKKGATSEAKHQHAEEEIQLLKWTTDLIKSGDNKQQDNVRIEVTAETHGKVIELGKKLTKIGIKNAFEIISKKEQKLSTLSEPELLKKEIKNITETTKLLEKITSPKTTPPSPGRTR